MNIFFSKAIRFVLNFLLYAAILISVTYYSYTNVPELYGVKNVLAPFNGMLMLVIILSITLAAINEVITLLVIRISLKRGG